MAHKRSAKALELRRQRSLTRRAALRSSFRDKERAETVFNLQAYEHVIASLDKEYPAEIVAPPFTLGEVLVDSRGQGSLQRPKSYE